MAQRGITRTEMPAMRWHDLGWGLTSAWGISTVFSSAFAGSETANLGLFWTVSMTFTPLTLLAFFLACRSDLSRKTSDMLSMLAMAGMVLGTVGLGLSVNLASSLDAATVVALQVISGAISSFGMASYHVLWGDRYTSWDLPRVELAAVCSLVLAFVCYATVMALPHVAAMVFLAALPVVSSVCLKMGDAESGDQTHGAKGTEAKKNGASAAASSFPAGDGLPAHGADAQRKFDIREFTRLGIGIVGVSMAISLFWSMTSEGVVPVDAQTFQWSVLSGIAVALLMMAYMTRYARALNLSTLYRWVLPLLTIAFTLLFFPGRGPAIASTLLVFAVQALMNLLTFIYFAELSQQMDVPSVRVFGLGRFFLEGGFLVGNLLTPAAIGMLQLTGSPQAPLFATLSVTALLIMMSIVIQNRPAFSVDDAKIADYRPGSEQASAEQANGLSAFEHACDQVAEAWLLTKREREILGYLAQGYSLPYIRNELYVSLSTIDTHVRHIYRKADVHSKEELITLVRQAMG